MHAFKIPKLRLQNVLNFFFSAPKNETTAEKNVTAKARTTPRFFPSEFTFPPGKQTGLPDFRKRQNFPPPTRRSISVNSLDLSVNL